MTREPAASACPAPHPQRAHDGMALHPDLELLGQCSTDTWLRCRRCGRFLWLVTDMDRYGYLDGWELAPALAHAALIARDLDAAVALLLDHDLPHGPAWGNERSLLALVHALVPDAAEDRIDAALAAHALPARWQRVRMLLSARRAGRAHAARIAAEGAAPALPFAIDVTLDGLAALEGAYEAPGALRLLHASEPHALWRLTGTELVAQPLAGRPRFRAQANGALVLGVDTPHGEALLLVAADGRTHAHMHGAPPAGSIVTPLDDGWWLLSPVQATPVRHIELRRPDLAPVAALPVACETRHGHPPLPRRMGRGWVVANAVDDGGRAQALTLFDEAFACIAWNEGAAGERSLAVVDHERLWAHTWSPPRALELWALRGARFVRRQTVANAHGFVMVDGGVVAARWQSGLVCLDHDGARRWAVPDVSGYLACTGDCVLVRSDEQATVVRARDGTLVRRFPLLTGARLLRDQQGTLYLVSATTLYVLRGEDIREVPLPGALEAVTTAGDAVVLRDGERGTCWVHGADGALRGCFEAPQARFSVVSTRGGPYVIEPGRVRVGRLW